MGINKRKLHEVINATDSAAWVSMQDYRQVTGVGIMVDADDGEGVTIQLRKATDASGTNAADLGDPVTVSSTAADVDVTAMASAYADELGQTAGGVDFTHVSATATAAGSPAPGETVTAFVIRSDGRFSE